MTPTVVTFKWKPSKGYRSTFSSEAVNVLRRMVARHYPALQRFVCVTDDPAGLDPSIEALPLWDDFAKVKSPHGTHQPSCYRRLKVFAPEARDWFGERFVCMDLDTVVTGDLRPIFNRPEDFIIWGETDRRSWYNGSLFIMTAGARRQVLEDFDPKRSPKQAMKAGRFGSDQGWISHKLGPGEAKWGRQDGVYSYRVHIHPTGQLPSDARIVMFHGRRDPWHPEAMRLHWVRSNYQ
jgi:hypothetical protein